MKAPVDFEFTPIAVLSMVPPLISTVANVLVPVDTTLPLKLAVIVLSARWISGSLILKLSEWTVVVVPVTVRPANVTESVVRSPWFDTRNWV